MKKIHGLNFKAIKRKMLSKSLADLEKIKIIGHRKIKCELNQGLVMINLYLKFNMFNVHLVM